MILSIVPLLEGSVGFELSVDAKQVFDQAVNVKRDSLVIPLVSVRCDDELALGTIFSQVILLRNGSYIPMNEMFESVLK